MQSLKTLAPFALGAIAACNSDKVAGATLQASNPLGIVGVGVDSSRYTAELTVRGNIAYTTTWGSRSGHLGNRISIWDVSGPPKLLDSVIVSGASTLGDVAVSDDGSLLIVATERIGGSIVIYSLADPKKPTLITQYHTANTDPGVHTAEIGRVNGKLYGFLSIDPINTVPARLVTVDLSVPSAPREVFTKVIGNPYVHDTFIRDGILFLALWNDGVEIWDVGGGGKGGTPETPVVLGSVRTLGGEAHNVWWYKDAAGNKRFAFVGEEGPGSVGSTSSGDIHVLDVSDLTKPKEVAFFHVPGAGTHNFSVDEANGVLYAAYYNGGVRAIDIRGDLKTCAANQQVFTPGANISRCDLRLMGRELGVGLIELNRGVYIWGVQYLAGSIYASDMVNGIWKLKAAK